MRVRYRFPLIHFNVLREGLSGRESHHFWSECIVNH